MFKLNFKSCILIYIECYFLYLLKCMDCKILFRILKGFKGNLRSQSFMLISNSSLKFSSESFARKKYKNAHQNFRIVFVQKPLFLLLLCRYTLDEFGTARRSSVVRGFIDALTRGGPGGTPRPIEMHSHDPMRYSPSHTSHPISPFKTCRKHKGRYYHFQL